MCINLFEPIHNVSESARLSTIVNENDSHSTLVVGLRDCSETLLPGGVPHLQFNSLILHIDCFDLEVDAYYSNQSESKLAAVLDA